MTQVYTKLFFKEKNDYSIISLAAFLSVLILGLFFLLFPSSKLKIETKQEVEFVSFANLSPSQLTIFWKTSQPVSSYILYGKKPDGLLEKAEDKLAIYSSKKVYHYANLTGLEPNTEYFFAVKVKDKLVGRGGEPFKFTTPPEFLPSKKDPLIGKIIRESGEPVRGAIVLLHIKGAYPLATFIGEKGEWVIPLGLVFDENGKKKIELSGKEDFEFKVLGENLVASGQLSALLDYSKPLVVGRKYFFNKVDLQKPNENKSLKNRNYEVLLVYPKPGSTISNPKPLIKGTGVPFEEVLVEIVSDKFIVVKTQVDEEGVWQVDLPVGLSPGRKIIRVYTKDSQKKEVKIVRDFNIGKSGESVLAAATPSGELETLLSPTPTFTSTPLPTQEITQISSSKKVGTPTPSLPRAGFNSVFVFLVSLIFLIPGVLLLLK